MNVHIYDIETLKEMFLIGVYSIEQDEYLEFEVTQYSNTLDAFFNYFEQYRHEFWVGYNSLSFDSQVVEWIYRNYHEWHELGGLEICAKIYQKAQDVIHNARFNVFPDYRETDLSFPQLDLFKIHHYDNKNRMVSLKRLEFEMDFPNIEEMPIHHAKEGLTIEEIQLTKDYCYNDVMATKEFYYVTIGETSHPLYKGDNKIEMRMSIEQEFGIPCLNYSNAKIGDEIIKKYYCEETGIPYKDLPKKGTFRKEIKLKYCIPPYVKFKTTKLKDFLKSIKTRSLKMTEDFEASIEFYGQIYTFAKGGLHNVIKGAIYESNDQEDLVDVDVGGYYPATIINNQYYPYHLGKAFLVGYSKVYHKRIEMKPLAKKDKRIKGIVAGLKEAGNCPYGKSSDMDSWLYDKQMTLATCITGELSLLMLIEDMELAGIRCIMANTDGATFIVPKTLREKFNEIKEEWVKTTTRKLSYVLEEVEFQKMIFSSVNDYIGIKKDGEVKYKGDFLIDFELHKNKSARVVNIALSKYFVEGTPIEDTIKDHKNLYDFCIRQKATSCFHYEGVIPNRRIGRKNYSEKDLSDKGWFKGDDDLWYTIYDDNDEGLQYNDMIQVIEYEEGLNTGEISVYDKLIRYYITNKGETILKIKNPDCETNASKVMQVHAGGWVATVSNKMQSTTVDSSTDINYNFYIYKAEDIIYKILTGGKKKKRIVAPNQLSLF